MVRVMRNLISRVFEDLEITSPTYVDKRLNYMQSLLRGLSLKKHKKVLAEYMESVKGVAGDQ